MACLSSLSGLPNCMGDRTSTHHQVSNRSYQLMPLTDLHNVLREIAHSWRWDCSISDTISSQNTNISVISVISENFASVQEFCGTGEISQSCDIVSTLWLKTVVLSRGAGKWWWQWWGRGAVMRSSDGGEGQWCRAVMQDSGMMFQKGCGDMALPVCHPSASSNMSIH